jgi:hypothetical protein
MGALWAGPYPSASWSKGQDLCDFLAKTAGKNLPCLKTAANP